MRVNSAVEYWKRNTARGCACELIRTRSLPTIKTIPISILLESRDLLECRTCSRIISTPFKRCTSELYFEHCFTSIKISLKYVSILRCELEFIQICHWNLELFWQLFLWHGVIGDNCRCLRDFFVIIRRK